MSHFASHALIRALDSLLPRTLVAGADDLTRNRARALALIVSCAAVFAVLSAGFHWISGNPVRSLYDLFCTPLALLVFWPLHRSERGLRNAHQINNPIASIMASAEYALLAAPESDDGGTAIRDEALRSVISEAARCGQIVRNVLRFARQQPTARWIEDLVPLVGRTATLCRDDVADHGGELQISLHDTRLPALVSPIEIEQVLVNLIRNAAEALEGSGIVRERAPQGNPDPDPAPPRADLAARFARQTRARETATGMLLMRGSPV